MTAARTWPISAPLWAALQQLDSRAVVRKDVAGMVDPADRADIDATLDGDTDAFAQLVRRHQQDVARRMRRFARDRGTIEELVHDVFVQAYFSLGRYRGDAPFENWLSVIATRVGYRYWKRRGRGRTVQLTGAEAAPAIDEPVDELPIILEQLPPRDRLVITLLHLENHPVAEVAKLTGWSRTMVKVQAFRARGKLKKILMRYAEDPRND